MVTPSGLRQYMLTQLTSHPFVLAQYARPRAGADPQPSQLCRAFPVFEASTPLLPVHPLNCVGLDERTHRLTDSRKEPLLAQPGEEAETRELVLHALARLEAPNTKMGRYRAPDSLLRFLQTL